MARRMPRESPRQPLFSQPATGTGVGLRVVESCALMRAVTVSPAVTMSASAHHT